MTDKIIGYIRTTDEYDKFKILNSNRRASDKHIQQMMQSIEGAKIIGNPVLVNEKFEIIDGQHRFYARKELGLPIIYISEDGLDIETVKKLNENSKNWSLFDFIDSKGKEGNEDYQRMVKFSENEKRAMSLVILMFSQYCTQTPGSKDKNGKTLYVGDVAKQGGIKLSFLEKNIKMVFDLHSRLKNVYMCRGWYSTIPNNVSLLALRFFIHIPYFNKRFDLNYFFEILENNSGSEKFKQSKYLIELIESFGSFYNCGKRGLNKLDFNALYEEYKKLIPTGKFLEDIE